ncbi:PrgI family protein [Candidatus Microgenomates bacterium]|nr:PrgI family protein [Candidatus Microgenomates bacterium]
MEQHPVPRQITSFEFKLIGFMTLKQFLFLIAFVPIGVLVYFLIPIPIIRHIMGFLVAMIGVLIAFVPINERPMDVFIKNLVRRLMSPTQYTYEKHNPPIYFLNKLYFLSDPHHVFSHIDSEEKLGKYLAEHQKIDEPEHAPARVQGVQQALKGAKNMPVAKGVPKGGGRPAAAGVQPAAAQKHPFLVGVVRTRKEIPLPGILIYIKDSANRPVRLLKTNPNGVFATFTALAPADYIVEPKDPKNAHFFDTIKVHLPLAARSLDIISRELL